MTENELGDRVQLLAELSATIALAMICEDIKRVLPPTEAEARQSSAANAYATLAALRNRLDDRVCAFMARHPDLMEKARKELAAERGR